MSIQLLEKAWVSGLPLGKKAVLMALANGVGCDNQVTISAANLAVRSSLSRRSVHRILTELEQEGFVTRHHSVGDLTTFTVHPDKVVVSLTPDTMTDPPCHHVSTPPDTMTGPPLSFGAGMDPANTIYSISKSNTRTRLSIEKTKPSTVSDSEFSLKRPKASPAYTPDFLQAWEAYPRRPGANKATTFKKWTAAIKQGCLPVDMIAGAKRYAAYCLQNNTEPKYIKHPETFFGPDRHWESEWVATEDEPWWRQL